MTTVPCPRCGSRATALCESTYPGDQIVLACETCGLIAPPIEAGDEDGP